LNNRPRRSALYVPADNARALEKARGLDADVLILDLEDAVAPDAKRGARNAAIAALPELRGAREVVNRINPPAGALGVDDLKAVAAARPDAILLPKVNLAEDVEAVAGLARDVPLWAMVETPCAVLNMESVARAGVEALVLGANDLLKDLGGRHRADRANLHYVMGQMVLVARAVGVSALDSVHNSHDDAAGFAEACILARDFGFYGKSLIHPSQIAPAHAAFTPAPGEVEAARRVLAAFADAPDKGAILLDGHMVEKLDAEIAERTILRAGKA
jgi:citrate lyase subunit beta/citryl-CoA lyase